MKNNSPVPTDKLYKFVNRASLAPRRATDVTEIIETRREKANLFKNLWLIRPEPALETGKCLQKRPTYRNYDYLLVIIAAIWH